MAPVAADVAPKTNVQQGVVTVPAEPGGGDDLEEVDGQEDTDRGGHRAQKPQGGKGMGLKTTVMTTGPGVIIATATASMNCCSLSHPNCWTTP